MRKRDDVSILTVTKENRDEIFKKIHSVIIQT